MEFGGREILIGLGIVLVVAILLDGFRRSRNGGQNKLRARRRKQPIFDDEGFDDASPELPGEVRVVGVRDEHSAQQLSRKIKARAASNDTKLTTPFREPEQTVLGLDGAEEQAGGGNDDSSSGPGEPEEQNWHNETGQVDTGRVDIDSYEGNDGASEASGDDHNEIEQDVIVLHLMASPGEQFGGNNLLEVLLSSGLRYGSQKIFHCHEHEDGTGAVLFSMTNSINPGIFELNSMADFSTPGLTFFMIMQDSDDPMHAFEELLGAINNIRNSLGGELKDGDRSTLTGQTAEHYRQQIMDYNRRRQLAS